MRNKVDEFLEYLEFEKKYSNNTIIGYENDLNDFVFYLENRKLDYRRLVYKDVTDYLIYLSDMSLKSTSINRHLSSIRSFYDYLMKDKVVENSPFKLVNGPKKEQKLPNYLRYDECL